jgi:hypothetical protein
MITNTTQLFRPGATALRSLLIGLAGVVLALTVQAQNVCTSSASLVNPLAADPSGLGGTGITAGANPGTGGSGGTGGTGGTGGIGGTGIVGVITGFASICVNDVEVHFDADTPVVDNGQAISARKLAVGQLVAVRAAGLGAEVAARHIALIHAAVGPVDSINPSTGEFTLLGQSARALMAGDVGKLTVGNWVRVSGLRLAQGQIAASHIESIAPQTRAQLNGVVGASDGDGFVVNGTLVRMDAQAAPARPQPGQEVLAFGRWDGQSFKAQEVQVEPTQKGIGAVEQVVLEGYVHTLDQRGLNLGNGALRLGSEVKYVGGKAAQLAVNQRVRVSGRVGPDKGVQIERVEFRSTRSGMRRNGQPEALRKGSGSSDDDGASSESEDRTESGRSGSSGSSEKTERTEKSGRSGGSDSKSSGSGSSGSGKGK